MPLHPQIEMVLDAMAKAELKPIESLTPPEARIQMAAAAKGRNANPAAVGRVEDRSVPGPGGDIRVRFYWPPEAAVQGTAARLPILVYYHGGGHVIGSIDTHDATARNLCVLAGALVASVDYRKGPENKFPGAVEDAWAVVQWMHANGGTLGGDPDRIAVGGDSAGGNLAAVVALLARDAGAPKLRLQVLVYPVSDYGFSGESYGKYGQGYGVLTADAMRWFRDHYLNNPEEAEDWRASPLKASDLSGVAPAFVITAEYDVLHDDGLRYAEALRKAGVPVAYKNYPGMIHAFFGMVPIVDAATQAQQDVAAALREAFAPS